MDKIQSRLSDRVEFFAVYIKEAHPSDGWKSSGNERVGIKIKQANLFEERVSAAAQCCGALEMTIPMVVDGIDDRVAEAYSGFPDRLYVIDRDGKIAFKSGRGPFGFIPAEMEQELLLMLMSEPQAGDDETTDDKRPSAVEDGKAKDRQVAVQSDDDSSANERSESEGEAGGDTDDTGGREQ